MASAAPPPPGRLRWEDGGTNPGVPGGAVGRCSRLINTLSDMLQLDDDDDMKDWIVVGERIGLV
jgi:hypothetical protein